MSQGQTGLVLRVPEAEPVVGRWRRQYDPVTAFGVPAHITVLFPWLPIDEVTANDRAALVGICAGAAPLQITFARLGRFPRTLWLEPEPAGPITHLTEAMWQRWPAYPPYAGEFEESIPHLTVADQQDPDALRDVVSALESALPFHAAVDELSLLVLRDGRWTLHSVFRLGVSLGRGELCSAAE